MSWEIVLFQLLISVAVETSTDFGKNIMLLSCFQTSTLTFDTFCGLPKSITASMLLFFHPNHSSEGNPFSALTPFTRPNAPPLPGYFSDGGFASLMFLPVALLNEKL